MIKILKSCNKLKETLSASKESRFYVENLYDGIDLVSHMTREKFESLSAHLLEHVTHPITKIL